MLLSSSITAGHGTPRPAYVPPVQHLGLLATLIVHPSMTTRTASKEKQCAADDAFRYLHQLNSSTPAAASGLTAALQFQDSGSSRSKRARTRKCDINIDDDVEDPGRIRLSYAQKESLFANAEDFWAVVGWAFNCSVAHEPRWRRWKLWLGLLLDIVEDDLEARYRESRESDSKDALGEALIAHYLAPFVDQGRNSKRRIMRAILANGTQPSLNQFPEIWRNETRPPKAKTSPKTGDKRTLDLDQGEFGDYFDSESDPDDATTTTPTSATRPSRPPSTRPPSTKPSRSPSTTPQPTSNPSPLSTHGGPTSLHLRHRLLTLLTRLSTLSPAHFLDPEDLFDLYTEFLRPLPLPVFTALLLSPPGSTNRTGTTDAHATASLAQMLLRPLLSASAPVYNANALTPADFAAHFAPFAANVANVGENAKVGVAVEALLRLLLLEGAFEGCGEGERDDVRRAVERGVRARAERVEGATRRRDGEALEALEAGGGRLRGLVGMI